MKWIFKVLAIGLAIALPVFSFCLSLNIVLRMPDIYEYHFKSTEVLVEIGVEKSAEEMGEKISEFMFMKQDNLNDSEESGHFRLSEEEAAKMQDLRRGVNIAAAIWILTVIVIATSVALLKRQDMDEEIRKELKKGIYIYVGFFIIYLLTYGVLSNTDYPPYILFTQGLDEESLIRKIFDAGLIKTLYMFVLLVATIIMGIGSYIIKSITKPKRIFSRSYY